MSNEQEQEIDLAAIHAFTIQLAREAGKMILEGSNQRTRQGADLVGQPDIKKNRVDRESFPSILAQAPHAHVRWLEPCCSIAPCAQASGGTLGTLVEDALLCLSNADCCSR